MASTSEHLSHPSLLVRKNSGDAQPDFSLGEQQQSKHWYTKSSESSPWPPPTLMSYLVSDQTVPDQADQNVPPRKMAVDRLRIRSFSEPQNRSGNGEVQDSFQDFPVIPMSFINILDLEEETKLYELLYECRMMESSIILDKKSLVTHTKDQNTTDCDTEKPCNVPFNHWLQYAITDVTRNTQKIKSFSCLDREVRMNILKHVTLQMFLSKMISYYDNEKHYVEWKCNFGPSQQNHNTNEQETEFLATLKAEAIKRLETSFHENFTQIISDLDSVNWRQDKMVMSLLIAIILYDPSYARSAQGTPTSPTPSSSRSNSSSSASLFSLVSPEIKITNERDVYIKILKKYLNHKSSMVHSIEVSEDEINVKLFQTLFGIKNLSAILESIDLSKQTLTLNVVSN